MFAKNASIGPVFFSERSGSLLGSGEEIKLKDNINSALLSCPTGNTPVKYMIPVASMAILVEEPPAPGLLLAINASIGPVLFLEVPKAPVRPGSEGC